MSKTRDLTIAFSSGHTCTLRLFEQDLSSFVSLLHAAGEIAALLGHTGAVQVKSFPFEAVMLSDGQDWSGSISYAGREKFFDFASRADLTDLRRTIAAEIASSELAAD